MPGGTGDEFKPSTASALSGISRLLAFLRDGAHVPAKENPDPYSPPFLKREVSIVQSIVVSN